jgi:uncharacterized membrane-anchored protein
MSRTIYKGFVVAALHVAIVASLGAKLMIDRATYPRVWARVAPVDPNAPIRGRYVRLRLEATAAEGFAWQDAAQPPTRVELFVQDGRLRARPAAGRDGLFAFVVSRDGERIVALTTPLAYFIPEHADDPSVHARREGLWAEVTLPRRGMPRPIRLGVGPDRSPL